MNTHADKTQENKSQSAANSVPQMQAGNESTFQFVDNRPETVAQRKLQEIANNSPRTMQLRTFQEVAKNGQQAFATSIQNKGTVQRMTDVQQQELWERWGQIEKQLDAFYEEDKYATLPISMELEAIRIMLGKPADKVDFKTIKKKYHK